MGPSHMTTRRNRAIVRLPRLRRIPDAAERRGFVVALLHLLERGRITPGGAFQDAVQQRRVEAARDQTIDSDMFLRIFLRGGFSERQNARDEAFGIRRFGNIGGHEQRPTPELPRLANATLSTNRILLQCGINVRRSSVTASTAFLLKGS